MRRRWEFWDVRRLSKELDSVPQSDRLDLLDAMDAFLKLEGINYQVDTYATGIKRLRHTNHSSGRCLFFIEERTRNGETVLIALTIYKKEKDEVPTQIMERAMRRKAEWQRKKTT